MSDDGASAGSDPLGDLVQEVRTRREERGDEQDRFAEAFESVEIEAIDREALWEDLSAAADDRPAFAAVETPDQRDVRVVPNRLCHGCEYFAKPPEMACTHEGSEIIERVDGEQFCVADCPKVEGPGMAADGGRP